MTVAINRARTERLKDLTFTAATLSTHIGADEYAGFAGLAFSLPATLAGTALTLQALRDEDLDETATASYNDAQSNGADITVAAGKTLFVERPVLAAPALALLSDMAETTTVIVYGIRGV